MVIGIVGMGVFLALLIMVNFGTDTCSFLNLSLSQRFGISFGTCMAIFNISLFIPVILLDPKLINIGTVMNMLLVGYISDFSRLFWTQHLPTYWFEVTMYRVLIFIVALIPFLIAVAFYVNANMGLAPYDAIPNIISRKVKLPYAVVRILWDFTAILIGVLAGKHLTIATLVMAFTIGPSIMIIGRWIQRFELIFSTHIVKKIRV